MMSLLSPQLQAFMAIADCKTVHGAADQLHLTQTAVTQRIRSLEKKLKTTLFIRSRRGMQMTPEAQALLRYCRAAKMLEGETLATLKNPGIETEITCTITAPSSTMRTRILPQCLPLMKRFPQLLLHYTIEDKERRHLDLKSGHADFAVIQEHHRDNQMQYKNLQPEHYHLFAPAAWKKRDLNSIIQNERIIDFDENDNATFRYLHYFDLNLPSKPNRYFINDTEQIAVLVASGLGYSVLPKDVALPYLKEQKIIELNNNQPHPHQQVLAWYHRVEPAHYIQEIIQSIH